MKPTPDPSWNPDPQLLAAYFDGELEGRDDVADLRGKLEAWLDYHPEAIEEWAQHQHLQMLWADTAPPEPDAATWNRLLDRIDAQRNEPIAMPTSRRPWLAAGIVAASIVVLVGLAFGAVKLMAPRDVNGDSVVIAPKEQPPDDQEVFAVATAEEVIVRRIDGADTSMVAVGQFPVSGVIELARPGEVRVNYLRPDPVDQSKPTVLENGPMIWAKLSSD